MFSTEAKENSKEHEDNVLVVAVDVSMTIVCGRQLQLQLDDHD